MMTISEKWGVSGKFRNLSEESEKTNEEIVKEVSDKMKLGLLEPNEYEILCGVFEAEFYLKMLNKKARQSIMVYYGYLNHGTGINNPNRLIGERIVEKIMEE